MTAPSAFAEVERAWLMGVDWARAGMGMHRTEAIANGAAVVTFPNVNAAYFNSQEYLYFSPDGNFFFGGPPNGFDMLVGVRTPAALASMLVPAPAKAVR